MALNIIHVGRFRCYINEIGCGPTREQIVEFALDDDIVAVCYVTAAVSKMLRRLCRPTDFSANFHGTTITADRFAMEVIYRNKKYIVPRTREMIDAITALVRQCMYETM